MCVGRTLLSAAFAFVPFLAGFPQLPSKQKHKTKFKGDGQGCPSHIRPRLG
jgi:hypothetical protein